VRRIIKAFGILNGAKRTYAVLVLCSATAISLPAQVFNTLHRFNITDGQYPVAGLIQATDGNLYGTTLNGGANVSGTVFKITPRGTLTTLHSFSPNTDGENPSALIQGTDGALYGTTSVGGTIGLVPAYGTVFKITLDGTLTLLHTFAYPEGSAPSALIQASDGNFYGTTSGAHGGGPYNGTVFKITPDGVLTTLYSFSFTDGAVPQAALIQAADREFYGTTSQGGPNQFCMYGCGTVFKITASGALTTLYNFCSQANCSDGGSPQAALVQAHSGNFYGTTRDGGGNPYCTGLDGAAACGTVFKITPDGQMTTLHRFNRMVGANPGGALIQASDGNFYGTTPNYGPSTSCPASVGCGTIFRITSTGALTTLYSFYGSTDGAGPNAPLVQARNGNFYGTTSGNGTVFTLELFVKTLPTSGGVGSAVTIRGTNLTGATSVTFNGIAAVFELVSPTEITTTVPPGGSTGEVQVVLPGGTLWSNVPFRVP
jgi:uncharacterized repeat protein (TIGR03803 family)